MSARDQRRLHRGVAHVFAERERLRQEPATDAQLATIWPRWNALPAEMCADTREAILTGQHFDLPDLIAEHERHLADLRQRFPGTALPLDEYAYCQAFCAVQRWHGWLLHHRTTVAPRDFPKDTIPIQWTFAHADQQAPSRLGILRAVAELNLTHPQLLPNPSPTLADIELLSDRHAAYVQARKSALGALDQLLYKVPGIRTGKPLRYPLRAHGIPRPPHDDVPQFLYLARLEALGLCSPERFSKFVREDFAKLARDQRQQFYRMAANPQFGKEYYAAFLIWVQDNRPVFEHRDFDWHWKDIEQAAAARGITRPPTGLKQWASRNEIRLRLKSGPASGDDRSIRRSTPLLSPAPGFGPLLDRGAP